MLCFKFVYSCTVIHHVAQISEALHDALMAFQGQDVEADLILHTHQPSKFHVIKTLLMTSITVSEITEVQFYVLAELVEFN